MGTDLTELKGSDLPQFNLLWGYDKSDEEKHIQLIWQNMVQFGFITIQSKRIPTLQELVDFLDGEVENKNYHRLTSIHHNLSCVLIGQVGQERARNIMERIARRGGLLHLGSKEYRSPLADLPDSLIDARLNM